MTGTSQQTLAAGTFCGEQTLPAGLNSKKVINSEAFPLLDGVTVDKWQILSQLHAGTHSALYLARCGDGPANTVIKLYSADYPRNEAVLKRLQLLRTPYILRLLGYGMYGKHPFEAIPFFAEGSLEGETLSEQLVVQVVLPQLAQALFHLHQAKLVHNDVKPANLFWKTRFEQLVLGDFDCVCPSDVRQQTGGTLAYMAPETLFSGGKIHTAASDYCAMGLTLLALLTGHSPLAGMSEKEVRRAWQRGISCPDTISPQLASLLQSLVRYDPARRPNHAQIERWLQNIGAHSLKNCVHTVPVSPVKEKVLRPLRFKDRIILDTHELVQAASQDWNYTAFLLRQHQLSDFLVQFSSQNYQLCEACTQTFDPDEGLFRLLQTLEPSRTFCWCGQSYRNLEEFARLAAQQSPLKADADPVRFLRLGMLRFYLEKNGGTAEQCEFASSLQQKALEDPDFAITQLLISMNARPEFQWYGHTFCSIAELADWILHKDDGLDETIEELFHSKQFEIWLNFIQCGRFITEVKSMIHEVRI